MENLLKEILPAGPLRYVILAMALLYYAYPELRKYWYEHRFRGAQLDHALRELELLKLRYEIEALAKEKELPIPAWPDFIRRLPSLDAPLPVPSDSTEGIRPISRFLYAALGCFLVLGIRIVVQGYFVGSLSLGYLAGVAILSIIAGFFGLIFGRESPLRAIVVGAFAPLIVWGLISLLTSPPPQRLSDVGIVVRHNA